MNLSVVFAFPERLSCGTRVSRLGRRAGSFERLRLWFIDPNGFEDLGC